MRSGARPGIAASEEEQAEFFSRVQEDYSKAAARTGESVHHFRVAGTLVRLRFAGSALIPTIVPGIAHPLVGPSAFGHDACEVCIWDSFSTGIPLSPPPRPVEDLTGRGNIWGFDSPRYRSAYQWGEGSVSVMDRETNRAVYWVPSYEHLPAWVLSSPLRTIFHWWLEKNGRQLVHAAAVGHQGRGILIPGRGGSGKSSTSLACLRDGMDFLSDDYVAVGLDPEPAIYHLYSTAKLDPRSLELYPELTKRCRNVHAPGFEKAVLFLREGASDGGYASQLRETLPLSLVLKPCIAGEPETTTGTAEPWEIEQGLSSETLAHLPHAGAHTLAILERISQEIPRAAIHLGTERFRIPGVIRQLSEQAASSNIGRTAPVDHPFFSIVAHFRRDDVDSLHVLAASIQRQNYRRVELLISVDGAASRIESAISTLPLAQSTNVCFLRFEDQAAKAVAWNRGIRESFGEWLIFVEPGDELLPGTLDALAATIARNAGSALIQGSVEFDQPEKRNARPIAGAAVRKSLFREYGLFDTRSLQEGRSEREWLEVIERAGLNAGTLQRTMLRAGSSRTEEPFQLTPAEKLRLLKQQRDRVRAATPNAADPHS